MSTQLERLKAAILIQFPTINIYDDGRLEEILPYVSYPNGDTIGLDGQFTALQMDLLLRWMRYWDFR